MLVIILLASFLELILPNGKIKPFVRFAIGLFILISILNPVLNFLNSDKDWHLDLWNYNEKILNEEEILKSGIQINEQLISNSDEIIKEKLAGQISAVAMLVEGIETVETKLVLSSNGELSTISLLVSPEILASDNNEKQLEIFSTNKILKDEEKERLVNKILNIMENMYGLDSSNIKIEFKEG
ncbi:MAG: stage III sporulation protein AF [Syntrophomonadaceae bacterium]|nr:stage III sporulation protein AF [Syntrophomonadaceae bacterium]